MLNFENKILFKILNLFVLFAIEIFAFTSIPEKPMAIVITSYNNEQWVYKNLTSVFTQDYSNYHVIYIDDASSDKTADEVESLVQNKGQEFRFTFIRNNIRKGGLYNLYNAVIACADQEIIVSLDGDDWLAHSWVLKVLNETYSKQKIWLTHGTMVEYPGYVLGWSLPIPEEITESNAFRKYRCPSHLKTFYAWLFKKIDIEDLKYQGDFFPMTWDQAIMFPMLEMAGHRHAFISELLYIYNMTNPINDNKVDAKLQNDLEQLIRSKASYDRLLGEENHAEIQN